GNRKGLPRQLLNILIVWMLTGIWHGAGWNFLLWGLWFALWLILEKMALGRILKALPPMVGRLYTWLVVLVGWVFFAIESGRGALSYLLVMFGRGMAGLYNDLTLFTLREYRVLLIAAAVASTPLVHRLTERLFSIGGSGVVVCRRVLEKLIPALLLLASIAYIVEASYNPFLYFRF
ncbi:MAG: MBOAT family protein, partial [Acetatifactor sp.]|nr:MBOAT family protein [Acetatifactor sp.]